MDYVIGTIIQYGSNTIPDGWLLCDGSAVSRTTYTELFDVIGTTFGAGNGSTTFNLPDLRGRIGVGKDSNDTDFDTLGETGGSKTNKLSLENYAHQVYNTDGDYVNNDISGNWNPWITGSNLGIGTNFATNKNTPVNNLQPYQVVNYIIKALPITPEGTKISDLTESTTINNNDVLVMVDTTNDETKKIKKENITRKTIYEGNLLGGDSIELTGVKKYLKIYAIALSRQNIIYEIDTSKQPEGYSLYSSGVSLAYDSSSAREYYISEVSYNAGTLVHTRIGYWSFNENAFVNRNNTHDYYIYKIDTYD